jgi:hypothetical protein
MAGSVTRHKSAYTQLEPADVVTFGAFPFAGDVAVGKIADFYGLPVPQAEKATPVGTSLLTGYPQIRLWAIPSGSERWGLLSTM